MPEAYSPDYEKWRREFEKFDVNSETILIGHSSGAAFLIRWLSENKVKINKLILVAPWLDPDGKRTTSFFNFKIAKDIKERVIEIHLLVSNDDDSDILESASIIKNNFPEIIYHEFSGLRHFTFGHMKTDKFPELLSYILE